MCPGLEHFGWIVMDASYGKSLREVFGGAPPEDFRYNWVVHGATKERVGVHYQDCHAVTPGFHMELCIQLDSLVQLDRYSGRSVVREHS